MRLPPHEVLRTHAHWVDEFGLSPMGWVRLENLCRFLPAAFQSFYLESRLAEGDDQLDFLPLIERTNGGFDALLEKPPTYGDEQSLGHWGRIVACCRAAKSLAIEHLWLEFDFPSNRSSTLPAPSPGVCVEPGYVGRHSGRRVGKVTDLKRALEGLRYLRGKPLNADDHTMLRRIYDEIPEDGNLIHVSSMLGRDAALTKLYLSLPKVRLQTFLQSVGWDGDVRRLMDRVSRYCEADTLYLDLSLAGRLDRRIGVAFSQFQLDSLRDTDPRWKELLSRFVADGVCDPAKAERIQRWPGIEPTVVLDVPVWVVRWLDLKMVQGRNGDFELKSYLGFRIERMPPLLAGAMLDS